MVALWLVLDQGTGSTRARVYDTAGRVVAEARQPLTLLRPGPGRVEQDPEQVVDSLHGCLRAIADQVRTTDLVAAGLATQRSSLLCWDPVDGHPLSPVISWMDRRTAGPVPDPAQRARIRRLTGLRYSPHYGAGKIRWCLDRLPAVREAVAAGRCLCGPLAAFLLDRCLQRPPHAVDTINASRTLLWNLQSGRWDPGLLDLFGVPVRLLPALMPDGADWGRLDIVDCPLYRVTGDQAAALHADGPPRPGRVYLNLGTGAFVQAVTGDRPARVDGLLTGVARDDGGTRLHTLEGTVNGAAAALAEVAGQTVTPARLDAALAAEMDPPLFLNGIGGLGSPWWVAAFPSRFLPQRPASVAARLAAVAESILFLVQANLERLAEAGWRPRSLGLGGGLSRSSALCQRLADLSGLPVRGRRDPEATLAGLHRLLRRDLGAEALPAQDGPCYRPRRDGALQRRYRAWRAALAAELTVLGDA